MSKIFPEPTNEELDDIEARSRAHALRIVQEVYQAEGINAANEMLDREMGKYQCPYCGICFTPDPLDQEVSWHGKDPVYGDSPPDTVVPCPGCSRRLDDSELIETD